MSNLPFDHVSRNHRQIDPGICAVPLCQCFSLFFHGCSWLFHGFSLLFHGFHCFSKNWISKNWKSIDIYCWTPSMNINGFPSMNINGFPSMNSLMVHQWIWAPSFGPLSLGPSLGPMVPPFGPHGSGHLLVNRFLRFWDIICLHHILGKSGGEIPRENNKGVLDRPWAKLRISRAISSTFYNCKLNLGGLGVSNWTKVVVNWLKL